MKMIPVLDHGYVKLVETWGQADEEQTPADYETGIIAAARQSTQGAFRGWEKDERLLRYLSVNRHDSPGEFAGMTIEVQAPIFVFRQWHRHRTQSVNEASARYASLPASDYLPSLQRVLEGSKPQENKQASGSKECVEDDASAWLARLARLQCDAQEIYQDGLRHGIPKELARLALTVSRYSRMRASANLRNWLHFLGLRLDPHAQWEIRQYAAAVGVLVSERFPRTWDLFLARHPQLRDS